MRWKRLFYYLLLNMIVTACTMVAVLFAWERYRPQVGESPLDLLFPTSEPVAALPVQPDAAQVTSVPNLGFEQYTVRTGDSLTAIAEAYSTTVDEILAFNEIDNPNALVVGIILNIPVVGGAGSFPTAVPAEATRPPLPAPTLAVSNLPTQQGIAELQVVTVIGAGDLEEERVVVRQSGEAQVSLQGWQIMSPAGDTYTFPQLVLFKDGAVTVFTKPGGNNVAELHWGLDRSVWAVGDVVSLLDPSGNIVAAFQVP